MVRRFLIVAGAVSLLALLWTLFTKEGQRLIFADECDSYKFTLPAHIHPPVIHPNNCINKTKVELGRRLFYEKRLSINNELSCGGCHQQKLAFSDGKKRAVGATKMVHPRNTPGLANVAYFAALTWNEPRLVRLENQALNPLLAESGLLSIIELGMSRKENIIIQRLSADERYPAMFKQAFGDEEITIPRIVKAIEAFEMTLLSYQSPYDRGEMSAAARRGQVVFNNAGCSNCHSGPNFNEPPGYRSGKSTDAPDRDNYKILFRNIALYNIKGKGDYPDYKLHGSVAIRKTQGLFAHTKNPDDRGKFRIPSLRNVALTAPYMHDGSIATLEDVIEHFNRGGRLMTDGRFAGDGRLSPIKDPLIVPLNLNAAQKSDLIAFLRALTDECFINNPTLSDPVRPEPVMPEYCRY